MSNLRMSLEEKSRTLGRPALSLTDRGGVSCSAGTWRSQMYPSSEYPAIPDEGLARI